MIIYLSVSTNIEGTALLPPLKFFQLTVCRWRACDRALSHLDFPPR